MINGKKGVLGCEKVHVRAYCDQIIALPSKRLFDALEEEYLNHL